jgi:hypothetical protein
LTYIDEIAAAIRRAVPAEAVPDADTDELFRIYAVLALAKGRETELEDVHDAWSAWMSRLDPDHRSLKPLSELAPDVQAGDEPYLAAIRRVAEDRGLGR